MTQRLSLTGRRTARYTATVGPEPSVAHGSDVESRCGPIRDKVPRALYSILKPVELSATMRDTTHASLPTCFEAAGEATRAPGRAPALRGEQALIRKFLFVVPGHCHY